MGILVKGTATNGAIQKDKTKNINDASSVKEQVKLNLSVNTCSMVSRFCGCFFTCFLVVYMLCLTVLCDAMCVIRLFLLLTYFAAFVCGYEP